MLLRVSLPGELRLAPPALSPWLVDVIVTVVGVLNITAGCHVTWLMFAASEVLLLHPVRLISISSDRWGLASTLRIAHVMATSVISAPTNRH